MKGTDLEAHYIEAAAKFVMGRRTIPLPEMPPDDTPVSVKWGELVRLVAWYGAIRAKAVSEGAPWNEPGEVYEAALRLRAQK